MDEKPCRCQDPRIDLLISILEGHDRTAGALEELRQAIADAAQRRD